MDNTPLAHIWVFHQFAKSLGTFVHNSPSIIFTSLADIALRYDLTG